MSEDSLLAGVRDLAAGFAERDAADPERYPAENVAALQRAGVIAAPFPAQYGGRGTALPTLVRVTEAVAASSPSTALLLAMPLGLAGIYGIGTEIAPEAWRRDWAAQIERAAAEYRDGQIYAACNSEKGAGGSIANTRTRAELRDGDFCLEGEKILASFGRHATSFFSTAKVPPEQLPGTGVVELFFVRTDAPGVEILTDWDGFGMRSTESHTVRYHAAPAAQMMGFPGFVDAVQPFSFWYSLFAAIPLGCAGAILTALATPAPASPALRLRFAEALMRYEAMRAYLLETAAAWRPAGGETLAARVMRTKTYVTQEATKLCAELFALSGGRHYSRNDRLARALADSFAGTALRPPLALALDTLVEDFSLGSAAE